MNFKETADVVNLTFTSLEDKTVFVWKRPATGIQPDDKLGERAVNGVTQ